MKNIIIGTAGHVDHGKTQLIKALSGIDTDRLSEEKKRGITIELGFAHIPNDAGYNIGVIDVPGHEKFIKNMLAGIGGIDFVVFVVAADEGIMPQTKEHFEILQSLGINDGIIAVTKTDMVDEEWMELLMEDVEDYFRGSFLEGKPIIPVSSRTGDNIDVLREEIIRKCDRENKRHEEKELFRLPVDRVFSMSGFGTVVTGTLIDGTVSVGDDVYIQPKGLKAKVRGIQTYGKDAETAIAGQRTAINLSGVHKDDIDRGDVLAAENAVCVTSMLDASLRIFSDTDRIVLNNSRVHLYSGSKEALAKVVLLDREAASAGETAFVQLRLEEPMAVRRGDRFIIRFYSPIITIGGGRIIDAMPDKHKRNRDEVLEAMKVLDEGSLPEIVRLKTGQRKFRSAPELATEIGVLPNVLAEVMDEETASGRITVLSDGNLLSSDRADSLKRDIEKLIRDYHEIKPLAEGVPKQELLSRLRDQWHIDDDKLLNAIIKQFTEDGVIVDRGKSIALAGFTVEYTDEQLALKNRIQEMYEAAGLEMIRTDEIYALYGDRNIVAAILGDLAQQGAIRKIDATYYISSADWDTAVEAARSFDGAFTLAEYRDRLDTSRKYASVLLPALDKEGITYFNGENRVAVG